MPPQPGTVPWTPLCVSEPSALQAACATHGGVSGGALVSDTPTLGQPWRGHQGQTDPSRGPNLSRAALVQQPLMPRLRPGLVAGAADWSDS